MKNFLIGVMLLLLATTAQSTTITLSLDSDEENTVGLEDTITSFTYDLATDIIHIGTADNFICIRDGITVDRFQERMEIRLNGEWVGTFKSLTYDLANDIIYVETKENNIICEVIM